MTDWHARPIEDALTRLGVDPARGLTEADVEKRRRRHGPNQLREVERQPWWRTLVSQFESIVIVLLGGAAGLAFATGRLPEGAAVLAVIAVNTAIGFVSERKAMTSMAALRRMSEHRARVRRDGREVEVEATSIVPGELVLVGAGELVPADLRLLKTDRLRVNEASLTGESVPVDKTVEPVPADAPLADRRNLLFKGTTVVDGSSVGVAVATGAQTQIGRIAELAEKAEAAATPLQRRLDRLGRRLALLTLAVAVAVAVVGFFVRRQDAALVVETAIALGIAAIPEGLPIVATIALARGMYAMAKRNALVNRLTAVETLGATRVIFSDKTGTLTENRMRLEQVVTEDGASSIEDEAGRDRADLSELLRRALETAVLCNSAALDEDAEKGCARGDPTELALLRGARRLAIDRPDLLRDQPQSRVEAFDPRTKKMATVHQLNGRFRIAVKGAPGEVLERSTRLAVGPDPRDDARLDEGARQAWNERALRLAESGLRVLAVADRIADAEDAEPYDDLTFIGLVGLMDPPRAGVKEAVDRCQAAGLRVEMVTGDQPETARAIAEAVGIVGDVDDPEAMIMRGDALRDPDELDDDQRAAIYRANIFARVSPEQKLNLVRTYQRLGEIVAMTGDGVNDAPALKKADIGVAMGRRGTEAAKQVADMVLRDDSLGTIASAIEEGRVIFANIRKSVRFMLTTNVAEVLAVAAATFAGWPLPLRPLQILYLNVLTDVFPALALGVGPPSGHEMRRPPRPPNEPVLTRSHWLEIILYAGLLAVCVLTALLVGLAGLALEETDAVTLSFATLAFGKLWFTFNLRDRASTPTSNEIVRNGWVWGAIGLCVVLLVAALHAPGLTTLLQTRAPDARGWLLVLALSVVPLGIGQAALEALRHLRREETTDAQGDGRPATTT